MRRAGPPKRKTRLSSRRSAAFTAARQEAVALAFARDGGCVARTLVPSVACGGPLDGTSP